MRQKSNADKQLLIGPDRPRGRKRLALAAVLMLVVGLGLSARAPGGDSQSVNLTFEFELAGTARLSVRVSVPRTLYDDSAPGAPTDAAGVHLRLTLLPRPNVERINHSF